MIRVNDKWDIAWRPGITVQDVLREMGFSTHLLVVSVNNIHVLPEQYTSLVLQEDDQVHAIHTMAGG